MTSSQGTNSTEAQAARPPGAVATTSALPESGVLATLLLSLSPHARALDGCLILLHPDGTLGWHDLSAGAYFERYVIPALRGPAAPRLRQVAEALAANAPADLFEPAPGVVCAVAPLLERRQVQGAVLIAARAEQFALTDEIRGVCAALNLDPAWLAPTPSALKTSTGLLLLTLAERLRVQNIEGELHGLSNQLANAYEELTLIDQVSGGMRVNRRSADFFRQVCLDVMQVMNVRGMGVALRTERVRQEPMLCGETQLAPGGLHRLSDQLHGTMVDRKAWLIANDLAGDRNLNWLAERASRLIAVPMMRRDQVLGCLFALDKEGGEFDSVDAKLLSSIANECAIYLENAMLFGDVHDLMMGLLHSLTSAVDAKDAYTCGHSERVALLSRHLAGRIALPDNQVERIYMAGLLHDVGKIGVPESVLQKTGRLTAEEFEQMKKHPQIGARILADVKQLEDIIPGVLHHHERYDGKGYPMGLAGQDIPIMGRIICLADCFDAMTSNRTYRKALPLEVALNEIRRCSGTQFDPTLAEAFLTITPEQFRILLRDHQKQAKRLLELQENLRAA